MTDGEESQDPEEAPITKEPDDSDGGSIGAVVVTLGAVVAFLVLGEGDNESGNDSGIF